VTFPDMLGACSTQRATRTHASGVRALGHGLPGRRMRLSAFTPSIGGRTSTLASLSPGVPRPFHANVTLVHRPPLLGFVGFVGFAFELIQCRSRDALERFATRYAGRPCHACNQECARTHTRMHARTRTHTKFSRDTMSALESREATVGCRVRSSHSCGREKW
jgi:hypothetical protein